MKTHDLTGCTFGSLTALGPSEDGRLMWRCRCVCGGDVLCSRGNLLAKSGTRCRCSGRAKSAASARSHGLTRTPEHRTWCEMRSRCTNPERPGYANYGGRGIKVCERWDSFENFLADMGPRPGRHSLERIDNNRGYEPANCRWATQSEQANNKRNNTPLTHQGRTLTIAQWGRELVHLGLNEDAISMRLVRLKWSVEKTLSTPHRGWGPGKNRATTAA